jgi:nucleotide-binding universal stress UspA family protein
MISRILLAVDGSQNAQRAVDIAAELSGKLKSDLFIVHVLMHGRPAAELVRMAEVEHLVKQTHEVVSPGLTFITGSHTEFLRGETSDPGSSRIIAVLGEQLVARTKTTCAERGANNIHTSVRTGDYAEEILDAAEDFKADMIVIGSRGLGPLKSTILGSVSQKVLQHAHCSVLTVR